MLLEVSVIGVLMSVGGVLTLRKRRAQRKLLNASRYVRVTNEIWGIVERVPPALISAPLRDALSVAFTGYAERLSRGPLSPYGQTLVERSAVFAQLPKRNTADRPQPDSSVAEDFRRLQQLLSTARADNCLCARRYALARVAVQLSADLADIEALCHEARHAALLHAPDRAQALTRRALANCRKLPRQTSQEVTRRIQNQFAGLAA